MKTQYSKVAWADVGYYGTDQYVYAIDKTAGQIKINQAAVTTLTIDFTQLPADRSTSSTADDALEEKAADPTAIELLATAYWWISKERASGKHQQFYDEYKEARDEAIAADMTTETVKPLFPRRRPLNTGYRSRGR